MGANQTTKYHVQAGHICYICLSPYLLDEQGREVLDEQGFPIRKNLPIMIDEVGGHICQECEDRKQRVRRRHRRGDASPPPSDWVEPWSEDWLP